MDSGYSYLMSFKSIRNFFYISEHNTEQYISLFYNSIRKIDSLYNSDFNYKHESYYYFNHN